MRFILLIVVSAAATISYGQAKLVKDINTLPDGMRSTSDVGNLLITDGTRAYFRIVGPKATSWWVTDGTTASTRQIDPDHTGSEYYRSGDVLNGSFIYQTISNGRSKLKKYTPGSAPQVLKEFETAQAMTVIRSGNKFIFGLQTGDKLELWTSDGTSAGTVKFKTIQGSYYFERWSQGDGTYNYFVIRTTYDHINTLWRTDGTEAGTVMLKPGGPNFEQYYLNLFVDGNDLYFGLIVAGSPFPSNEFWKSDGTEAGTVKVKQLSSQVNQNTMQKLNSQIIFGTNGGIWVSDGTEAGTVQVATSVVIWGTIYHGLYYAVVWDSNVSDYVLIKTDGTAGNIAVVAPVSTYQYSQASLPHLNDKMIFSMKTSATGEEVGISDGTTAGTVILKDINPGTSDSGAKMFGNLGSKTIFMADDGVHGYELWVTDGTTEGTTLLLDGRPGTDDVTDMYEPRARMIPVGDKLLFPADGDGEFRGDLWITDGTEENTEKLRQNDLYYRWIGNLNGDAYFAESNKMYKVSGATWQVSVVKDLSAFNLNTDGYAEVSRTTEINGKILFTWSMTGDPQVNFGWEYWVTDGTEAGTHILKDINPGAANAIYAQSYVVMNGKNFFSANNGTDGVELWTTDGTAAGTQMVLDINPSGASSPYGFTQVGNYVYFLADDGTHGPELWKSDGTPAGTTRITDTFPADVELYFPSELNGLGVFATKSSDGWEVWRTTGTANGTIKLRSFGPNNNLEYFVDKFVKARGKLFFAANDGIHGWELWTTDGSVNGTQILELVPGIDGKQPWLMENINDDIYFITSGEFWRTKGTLGTTEKILDMQPYAYKAIGNKIYFFADTNEYGVELFVMPITKFGQTITLEPVPDKTEGGEGFVVRATASSELGVFFYGTPEDKITMAWNAVLDLKPGKVTITAKQPGDNNFLPAEDKFTTFCVNPKKPVVTLKEDKGLSKILQSSADAGNQWYLNGTPINNATSTTFEAVESGNYTVMSSVDECKSELSVAMPVTITGMEEELNGAMFPNPASDKLFVQWNNPNETVGISIFDSSGRQRFNTSFTNSIQVSVGDYSTGIYLVRLSVNARIVTRKFMKQ